MHVMGDYKIKKDDFDEKLEKIEGQYDLKKRSASKRGLTPKWMNSSVALALRVAVEMFSGIALSAFIGWQLDRFFDIHGICLGIFILLGGCAGIVNVIRVVAPDFSEDRENSRRGK